jgi:hypothetical protein
VFALPLTGSNSLAEPLADCCSKMQRLPELAPGFVTEPLQPVGGVVAAGM